METASGQPSLEAASQATRDRPTAKAATAAASASATAATATATPPPPPKGNHVDTNHQVRTQTNDQQQRRQLDSDEPLSSSTIGSQVSSFGRDLADKVPQDRQLVAAGPQPTAASNCLTSRASARPSGKLSHRSQSSPSSLTTHKFGLRPTPSPPRLIIDHQTGDIIESYPEQPVYLRTYQPLDADDCDESTLDDSSFSQSLSQQVSQSDRRPQGQQQQQSAAMSANQLGHQQRGQPAAPSRQQGVIPPPHSGKVYFAPPETSNNILISEPPFGPQPFGSARPLGQTSSGANAAFKRALNKLHEGRTDIAIVTEPDDDSDYLSMSPRRQPGGAGANEMRVTTTSASRANALLAQQKQYQQQQSTPFNQRTNNNNQAAAITTTTATTNATANQLLLARNPSVRRNNTGHSNISNKTSQLQEEPPAIEDFKLYNFCYNFRVLLVILLSSLIIYLLVVPLHLDCTKFRPTFSYLSIIVSSVNLICIVIFTLFWYCKGVTRTMYANLSSSAFIVTIYSILVAINLALAIVFFFVNTCHFQKLIVDHPSGHLMMAANGDEMVALERQHQLVVDEITNQQASGLMATSRLRATRSIEDNAKYNAHEHMRQQQHQQHQHQQQHQQQQQSIARLSKRHHQENDNDDFSQPTVFEDQISPRDQHHQFAIGNSNPLAAARRSRRDYHHQDTPSSSSFDFNDATASNGHDHNDGGQQLQHQQQHFVTPSMSPIEAAWEYFKEQLAELRRNFNHFMINYDLKFIGALHALCAICLQYLAIKVAVVRSYYCSPDNIYV